MRVAGYALVVPAVLAFAVAAFAASEKTPKALASALLVAKIPSSQLPKGLPQPTVKQFALADHVVAHHGVGGVAIAFNNAEAAEVVYWVFPTHTDAVADYEGSKTVSGVTHAAAPSSLPKPAQITNGHYADNGKTIGITAVECVSGNVIILAVATSAKSKVHGDIPVASALAVFGLKHLSAVRTQGAA